MDALATLKDGRYICEIFKPQKNRTVPQNNSGFGIAYQILQSCFIESTGEYWSIDDVHKLCKAPENEIIPKSYIERLRDEYIESQKNIIISGKTGQSKTRPFRVTTTKMTTVEYMEYYRNMQKFAAEFFGADIPDPEPNIK